MSILTSVRVQEATVDILETIPNRKIYDKYKHNNDYHSNSKPYPKQNHGNQPALYLQISIIGVLLNMRCGLEYVVRILAIV